MPANPNVVLPETVVILRHLSALYGDLELTTEQRLMAFAQIGKALASYTETTVIDLITRR
jgi:hypothetical protein